MGCRATVLNDKYFLLLKQRCLELVYLRQEPTHDGGLVDLAAQRLHILLDEVQDAKIVLLSGFGHPENSVDAVHELGVGLLFEFALPPHRCFY
jgi:hypothetical protein